MKKEIEVCDLCGRENIDSSNSFNGKVLCEYCMGRAQRKETFKVGTRVYLNNLVETEEMGHAVYERLRRNGVIVAIKEEKWGTFCLVEEEDLSRTWVGMGFLYKDESGEEK